MSLNINLAYLTRGLNDQAASWVTTKFDDIIFPRYVHVAQGSAGGMTSKTHYGLDVITDLDDGLIGYGTTETDQIDIAVNATTNKIVPWVRHVTWTKSEIERARLLNVPIQTEKMNVPMHVAQQTLQKVAFAGHGRDAQITGLLNNPNVGVLSLQSANVKGKKVQDLTYDQIFQMFSEIFKEALAKTNGTVAPNRYLVSASDYGYLAFTRNALGTSALENLSKTLDLASGYAEGTVKILPIPDKYANTTENKVRAMAYFAGEDHVVFDVPKAPQVISPKEHGLISYVSGVYMEFGGVVFKQPSGATYIDF